jgi:hypothetical protein
MWRLICVLLVVVPVVASADEPPPIEPTPPTPAPTEPTPAPTDAPTPAPTEPAPAPVTEQAPAPSLPAAPTALNTPTIVTGRVTDVLGRPVGNARVYVLSRLGERHTVKTDKDGRYKAKVNGQGTYGVVMAIDKAHTFRTVLAAKGQENTLDIEVDLDTSGGEVIKIEDKKRPQPKTKPKPQKDPTLSLPYSDEAVERDAWARAWLLLDLDEKGHVTRLKLLKAPGFDLDRTAIVEGIKLKFDPARDAQGRPLKTYILWTMEWPAWGWLIESGGTAVRRPPDHQDLDSQARNLRYGADEGREMVRGTFEKTGGTWARPLVTGTMFPRALETVPCLGSGPLNLDLRNRAYRDCSQPDMRDAEALPWITRETIETALAEIEHPGLELTEEPPPQRSKIPPIIATGVTAGLVVGFVVSYMKYNKNARKVIDSNWQLTVDPEGYNKAVAERDRWSKISIGFAAASLVSGGVSLFLWNRTQTKRSFSVQATNNNGAAISYGGAF